MQNIALYAVRDFRLKEREDKRRNEQIASHESGKAELRKILEEIEEDRRKSVARVSAAQ